MLGFMRSSSSALALAFVTLACNVSGADEPVSEEQQEIAFGAFDEVHESVFALISHQDESGSLCTGTLIAPNLILTARHWRLAL